MVVKQDQLHVSFDLTSPTTYVVSGMGSGKSTQLVKLLGNDEFKTIVCLSFRLTFTSEFAKKYDLVSYQAIKGNIKLSQHPRVIVQVDSLFRMDVSLMPDLLIVDEVESILEKIDSSNQAWAVIFGFIQLMDKSKKVVIMDGLLEIMTIKYLNIIRKTDNFTIFHNTFMVRSDYQLSLY